MIKNTKFVFFQKAHELEDLKILFNKENYDLLEIKTKPLIQKYPNVPICCIIFLVFLNLQERCLKKR